MAKQTRPQMLPLDYLLTVIADEKVPPERRDRIAMFCAPYCHPKLINDRLRKKDTKRRAVHRAKDESEWQEEMKHAA